MHVTLNAFGMESKVQLWQVDVDSDGRWTYQSRAIEQVDGHLPPEDHEQFRIMLEEVPWDKVNVNHHMIHDDRFKFELVMDWDEGEPTTYVFSEAMRQCPQEFRDLVHFLRHNVVHPMEPNDAAHVEPEYAHRPPM